MYLAEDRQLLGANTRVFSVIGILGGFTTFSAFGYETFELLRDRSYWLVLCNVAGNAILGIGAVFLGRIAAKLLGI